MINTFFSSDFFPCFKMSAECAEPSDPFPLSLVVNKKDFAAAKLEPSFEPRKRFKRSDRVSLEGRAEEILVEIEPDIQDEEEISIGDERQRAVDQVVNYPKFIYKIYKSCNCLFSLYNLFCLEPIFAKGV